MEALQLKPATPDDIQFVWECRQNLLDPISRKSQEKETLSAHSAWMTTALQDPARMFLIVWRDITRIGYVRFDSFLDQDGWLTSIALLPQIHGKGYGKKILEMGCRLAEQNSMTPLYADIHLNNHASLATFHACDFQDLREELKPNKFARLIRRKTHQDIYNAN